MVSQQPIWFKRGSIRWKCPGGWGRKTGFVYVLFWADGFIKVGASCNPRKRVSESYYKSVEERSVIIPLGRRFRSVEKQFHITMRPLNIVLGYHARQEVYLVEDAGVRAAIMTWVERLADESSLLNIQSALDDFLDSYDSKQKKAA